MSEPFLGEIRLLSFNFPPRGWALCNGQLLQINQNQALFAILGTTYGGDGRTNFALPNLQGRSPLHFGSGGGNNLQLGAQGGEAGHTLNLAEIPPHQHSVVCASTPADQGLPAGNLWANGNQTAYAPGSDSTMGPAAIQNAGGGQAHANMSPFLTLNFCIALAGIFPSRN